MADAQTSGDESPVDKVIALFLEAEQEGLRPDPDAFLLRYPELERSLRSFFENYRALQGGLLAADAAHAPTILQTAGDTSKVTPAPSPLAPRPAGDTIVLPQKFGRYRVMRMLGKGGMGAVFLAEDAELHRRVAIKVPTLSTVHDPEVGQRFEREARAAAILRHPHICPVFDVGEIEGIRYLTMAYIDGAPLSKVASPSKPVSPKKAATAIRKLALALAHAHRHGVVHRDLKSSNIIVDRQGEPIVMDFGLARFVSEAVDVRLTQSGQILGTPAYMSPEHLSGDSSTVGPQADVYSLGVIFYELLTGRLPFDAPLAQLLTRILFQAPPPPSQFVPGLSPPLEAICLKMIAKAPADRYSRMDQVAEDLGGWLLNPDQAAGRSPVASANPPAVDAGLELPATPTAAELLGIAADEPLSERQRSPQPVGHRGLAMGGLALLAVAAAAIAWNMKPSTPSADPGEDEPREPPAVAPLPDLDEPAGDQLRLVRTLSGAPAPGFAIAFSPDNEYLVAVCDDGKVRAWDLELGRVYQEYAAGPEQRGVFFLPDSDRFVIVRGGQARQPTLWSVGSGRQREKFAPAPHDLGGAALYADPVGGGSRKLLAAGAGNVGVHVWDLNDFQLRPLYRQVGRVTAAAFLSNAKSLVTGEEDGTIRVLQLDRKESEGSPVELRGHSGSVTGVAPFSDNRHVLTVTATGEMWMWDLNSQSKLWEYAPHPAWIGSVRLFPGERFAATGCLDGRLRIWDLESGHIAHQVQLNSPDATHVALSSDGALIAAVGGWSQPRGNNYRSTGDFAARVWATPKLPGPSDGIEQFTIAPDAGRVTQPEVELLCAPHATALPQKVVWGLSIRNRDQVAQELRDLGHPPETLRVVVLADGSPVDQPAPASGLFDSLGWRCGAARGVPHRIQLEFQSADGKVLSRSAPIPLDATRGIDAVPVSLANWATHKLAGDLHFEERSAAALGNNLEELQPGRQILGGVLFNVEDAVIELCGPQPGLPGSVSGVEINQPVEKLHFLQLLGEVAGKPPPQGIVYGEYTVHYADGMAESIPLTAARIADWTNSSSASSEARACWIGSNRFHARLAEPVTLRLWLFSWQNPRPEVPITTLDFTSTRTAHPTLVGLSVQRREPEAAISLGVPAPGDEPVSPIGTTVLDSTYWKVFNHKGTLDPDRKTWEFDDQARVIRASSVDNQDVISRSRFDEFTLELEYRWIAGGKWTDDGAGIVVLATGEAEQGGWAPQGIEIDLRAPDTTDGAHTGNGGFVSHETPVRSPLGLAGDKNRFLKPIKSARMKPVGEFNRVRIVVGAGTLDVWINGSRVNKGTDVPRRPGAIALRNARSDVEFRNVTIDPQPPAPVRPPPEVPFLELVRDLRGHTGSVSAVGITDDGKFGFSAGGHPDGDQMIHKWDLSAGDSLKTLDKHSDWVDGLAVSDDGKWLLSASHDKSIRIWNGAGILLASFPPPPFPKGHWGAAISAGGRYGAVASDDGRVHVFDVPHQKRLKSLAAPGESPTAVALAPNDTLLAAGGRSSDKVYIWDFNGERPRHVLPSGNGGTEDLRFSPDGTILATIHASGTIQLWSAETGEYLGNLSGHGRNTPGDENSPVRNEKTGLSLAFVLDGMHLISAGSDETLRLWNVKSGEEVGRQIVTTGSVRHIAHASRTRLVLTGTQPASADPGRQQGAPAQLFLWRLKDPLPAANLVDLDP